MPAALQLLPSYAPYAGLFLSALAVCIIVCSSGQEGAVLFVPYFTFILPLLLRPLAPREAVTMSLLIEVFGFASSLVGFWRAGLIDAGIALRTAAYSLPAAVVGGLLIAQVSKTALLGAVAVGLFAAGLVLARAPSEADHQPVPQQTAAGNPQPALARSLVDRWGRRYDYRFRHDARRTGIALLGGVMMGLLGFGIGALGVPDLLLRRIPIRVAVGTSRLIIFLTAFAGLVPHMGQVVFGSTSLALDVAGVTIPAVLLGGQLAPLVSAFVPPQVLKRFVFVLLIGLSLITALRAVRVM